MLKDIIEVRPLEGWRLRLRFEDGMAGDIDVSELIRFEGIFAPLRDPHFFEQVRVHPELGVICCPNGADLDSDVLYARVSGTPVPSFEVKPLR